RESWLGEALRRRRRVEFIPQAELDVCGASCMAMALAFHGRHVPMARLRKDCLVSRNDANAMDIVQAARVQSLHAGVRRLERLEELAALPSPAVLHWDFNQFVVLERVRGNVAVIIDLRIG